MWADIHSKLETDLSENKCYLWKEVLPDFTDLFLEILLCNVAVLKNSVKRIHLLSICLLAGNGLNNFLPYLTSSPIFISSETAGGERSSPQPPFIFSTLLLQWNNRFQELTDLQKGELGIFWKGSQFTKAVVINSNGAKNNFTFSIKLLLTISYKYLVPQQYLCWSKKRRPGILSKSLFPYCPFPKHIN